MFGEIFRFHNSKECSSAGFHLDAIHIFDNFGLNILKLILLIREANGLFHFILAQGGGGRKIPGLPSTISHLGDLIHSQPGEGRSLPPPTFRNFTFLDPNKTKFGVAIVLYKKKITVEVFKKIRRKVTS